MRRIQGLLFFGLGLFSLRWAFLSPDGLPDALREIVSREIIVWYDFCSTLTYLVIGAYVLATGGVTAWRGQVQRYSPSTFLSIACFFLGLYAARSAVELYPITFVSGHVNADTLEAFESLTWCHVFFVLLGIYYLVCGEIGFWKWRPSKTESG